MWPLFFKEPVFTSSGSVWPVLNQVPSIVFHITSFILVYLFKTTWHGESISSTLQKGFAETSIIKTYCMVCSAYNDTCLVTLYKSLVCSLLDYVDIIYDNCSRKLDYSRTSKNEPLSYVQMRFIEFTMVISCMYLAGKLSLSCNSI